jgi:hypothetical protein
MVLSSYVRFCRSVKVEEKGFGSSNASPHNEKKFFYKFIAFFKKQSRRARVSEMFSVIITLHSVLQLAFAVTWG